LRFVVALTDAGDHTMMLRPKVAVPKS